MFRTTVLLAALTLSCPATAQGSKPYEAPAIDVATFTRDSVAVGAGKAGEWLGSGPSYGAQFTVGGFAFQPDFGELGDADCAVHLTPTSVRRTRGAIWSVAATAPEGSGDTVYYRRDDFVESYELRADAIEQSFTFERLPEGDGDLVVRMRVDTGLSLAVATSTRVEYERPGVGRVTVGRVVGIDADGRRAEGWLRATTGTLELGLPESFVAAARLPLVLDPPIGTVFEASGSTSGYLIIPGVAYDVSEDVYLVTWTRHLSGTDLVEAQRLNSDGTRRGGFFLVGGGANFGFSKVANINSRNKFVVAWTEEDGDLVARSIPAAPAAFSPIIRIASGVARQGFDLGGDATTTDNDALVVFARNNDVFGAQIEDSPSRGFHVFGTTTIAGSTGNEGSPRIAKSGGTSGRYLVVWHHIPVPRGLSSILGAVIDREIGIIDAAVNVRLPTNSIGGSTGFVDGDGDNWIVVYSVREAPGVGYDVMARSVRFRPTAPTATEVGPEMPIEADAGSEEFPASVTWLGNSALVTFMESLDLFAKTVDPFSCAICERQFTVEDGVNVVGVVGASVRSGGGVGDEALILWGAQPDSVSSSIRGLRFRADDGNFDDLGGGCGIAGSNYATCARADHGAFALRVRSGIQGNAFLFLGTRTLGVDCGACRLIPDPQSGLIIPTATDFRGNAEVLVPLQSSSLRGLSFLTQWAILRSSGTCGQLGADFSNALRVTIQ